MKLFKDIKKNKDVSILEIHQAAIEIIKQMDGISVREAITTLDTAKELLLKFNNVESSEKLDEYANSIKKQVENMLVEALSKAKAADA